MAIKALHIRREDMLRVKKKKGSEGGATAYTQGVGEDWLTTSDCVLHGDWVTMMGGPQKTSGGQGCRGVQEAEEA